MSFSDSLGTGLGVSSLRTRESNRMATTTQVILDQISMRMMCRGLLCRVHGTCEDMRLRAINDPTVEVEQYS